MAQFERATTLIEEFMKEEDYDEDGLEQLVGSFMRALGSDYAKPCFQYIPVD